MANNQTRTERRKDKPRMTAGAQVHRLAAMKQDPEAIREAFRSGTYPYKTRMTRKTYDVHKQELQVELLKVQSWGQGNGATHRGAVRGP